MRQKALKNAEMALSQQMEKVYLSISCIYILTLQKTRQFDELTKRDKAEQSRESTPMSRKWSSVI